MGIATFFSNYFVVLKIVFIFAVPILILGRFAVKFSTVFLCRYIFAFDTC